MQSAQPAEHAFGIEGDQSARLVLLLPVVWKPLTQVLGFRTPASITFDPRYYTGDLSYPPEAVYRLESD